MSSSNGAKTSKQLLKQRKRVFQSKSEGNWKRTNAATHVVCHVQQQLDCRARHCKKNKKGNPGRIMIALGVWQTQTDRQRTESNRNRNRSGEGTKRKQFIRLRTNRAIRQVELGLAMLPLLTSDSCRGLVVVVRGLAWS